MDEKSKKFAYNRIKKPLYHYFGNLEYDTLDFFVNSFSGAQNTISNAMELRDKHGLDDGYRKFLENYGQYDIQFKKDDEFGDERDYKMFSEAAKPYLEEIAIKFGALVYRTRYATIEPDDVLEWHVDQPTMDRWCIVLEGEQTFEIKTRQDIFPQKMMPGQIWFINSSWEHRVINTGNKRRLALLGCFEYNVT
jgi:mannose-6-phosphate isomerase-like protein (cupin superfamily)